MVDEDVIIVEPTSPPVDTHFVELLLLIDAAKRSGASLVTVVVPYLGYQRQDHIFRDGEAVSLDVVRKIIESVGASRVLIIDGHSSRIEQLFTIPVLHLSALPLFAERIRKLGKLGKLGKLSIPVRQLTDQKVRISDASDFSGSPSYSEFSEKDAVLVSPDMGGIRRIKILSQLLGGMPWVAIEKNRDVTTGSITALGIQGQLQGKKRAIIIDDMISSGKTIVQAADLLQKNDISDIVVFATHAVFSEKAPAVLQKSIVSKVYVTDTIAIPEKKKFVKLEVLSVAPMIARAIQK